MKKRHEQDIKRLLFGKKERGYHKKDKLKQVWQTDYVERKILLCRGFGDTSAKEKKAAASKAKDEAQWKRETWHAPAFAHLDGAELDCGIKERFCREFITGCTCLETAFFLAPLSICVLVDRCQIETRGAIE